MFKAFAPSDGSASEAGAAVDMAAAPAGVPLRRTVADVAARRRALPGMSIAVLAGQ